MGNYKQGLAFKLAMTGAFGALVVILGITRLGFITVSPVISFTIMHVPVILVTLIAGLFPGMGVAFIFGLFSLIQAALNPTGILDPFFVNPFISIVPRLFIPIVTWGIYELLTSVKLPKIISGGIAGFLGSCANSFFVALALVFITAKQFQTSFPGTGLGALLGLFFIPGGFIEAGVAAAISIAVLSGVIVSAANKKSKLSSEVKDEAVEELSSADNDAQ